MKNNYRARISKKNLYFYNLEIYLVSVFHINDRIHGKYWIGMKLRSSYRIYDDDNGYFTTIITVWFKKQYKI